MGASNKDHPILSNESALIWQVVKIGLLNENWNISEWSLIMMTT